MFIADYMTTDPVTITADITLTEARQLLDDHHFRHLPVVDGAKKLIGVVSDRDLRLAYPSTVIEDEERERIFQIVERTPVTAIMTANCSCIGIDATLDDALLVFERDKVGALPVVTDDDVVIGIFSMRDLTAAYKKLFGAAEKGSSLIAVLDEGKTTRSLSRIASLLEDNDVQCTRLIKIAQESGFDRIYMRVNTYKVSNVHKLLQDSGFTLLKP
ncbi:CBS domain-containing protein [Desulfofustis glycolicus]|uniref:Acetoin utilization protein AcuB n=1 Tax=Desulfofustis glycolicus DSM 9705 TaxID=1121409 RepID=A0A1M5W952_9BACT|nr:CBS domain-containing protein [Desulfofustis glycolicus]MCB2217340.1 CBS domain-containing protein [Desulfobulbaceae bacterium]SHH83968.1 acetoin utilization protein AcuB [Desulfofustis glycolicus DSM 9705]